jgi:triosephosphate isomerase
MELPLILVNFKSYTESVGKNAIKLSEHCESVSKKYRVNIVVAPTFSDLYPVSRKFKIKVFSQHVDPVDAGQFTGHITCYAVKEAGAVGTLINHSEKRLKLEDIKKCVKLAKKYKLISMCFASDPREVERVAHFSPDFIAIEPPELIASGISVSTARPEIVTQTVDLIKRINPKIKVLCGAGISKAADVKRAIELGTVGIGVSSAVVKSKNPKKLLIDFAKAAKSF